MATRFCTCFAALLTLGTGAYTQAASEPIRAISAGDSSVTRQPISIDEVSAALARLPRLSGFVAFQHGEIVHQQYARGGAFAKPINIKSASKSILNALTAIALQRGDLPSLDTPMSRYLPQYFASIPKNDKRRTITVRHLLTMSSGLPSTSIYSYGEWVGSRDWIAYALSQDLVSEPGSRMTYSTGDTHLLAAVLASAAGTSLRAYAQRHLSTRSGCRSADGIAIRRATTSAATTWH
jgi:CubicO group peptidase (beta-lactamase class C family)